MSETTNPYQAPQSDVTVAPQAAVGGDIAQTLAGRGQLRLSEVMNDAWRCVIGAKGFVWGGFLALYALIIPLNYLGMYLLEHNGWPAGVSTFSDIARQFVLQLLVLPLAAPVTAGIYLAAARHAAGRPVLFAELLAPFQKTGRLVGARCLVLVLSYVGFALLLLPGLYLAVAYILTPTLIADRDMGIWQAMETSRKLVSKHWFTVFFVGVVGVLVMIGSGFLLAIPIIWTFPWLVLCLGVVYRNLAGVRTP